MIGKRFHRWIVLERAEPKKYFHSGKLRATQRMWKCQCDCGSVKIIAGISLRSSNSKSCGCLQRDFNESIRGLSAKYLVLAEYKSNAKRRYLVWDLNEAQFYSLVSRDCFYCGSHPKNKKTDTGQGKFIYNGIDRLNNKNGYTEENCVPCCKICNRAKSDMSLSQYFSWLRKVFSTAGLLK